jgi:FixJ family two-component response regulator
MQRRVIAIVDDDPGIREAMQSLISAFGLDTVVHASGQAFLDTAAASEAACLIVDMHLGDMTGVDVVRRLAAAGLKFPTIFITGSPDETLRDQAAELGCVAYLHKPFVAKQMIDAIAQVIGRDFLSV